MTNLNNSETNNFRWLSAFVAAVIIAAVYGCASNYGNMIQDPAVTIAFKTNKAFDDHTYYFRNWLGEPIAVVGIKQGYTLDSPLWFEVDLDEVSVRRLWERMSIRDASLFKGSRLRDPAGNDMGIIFTDYEGATIKMRSATVIEFITPYGVPRYGDNESVRPAP